MVSAHRDKQMRLAESFERATGHVPAAHQLECANHLTQGRSVILRAPTGSGKSEAVWLPFLLNRNASLPYRMIHVLPRRALANQLADRAFEIAAKLDSTNKLLIRTMHGQRPESVLFYADMVFATLDQVVTSYACTPLTLGVRHGNIPAGAVAGSFLVFDEIHTYEPAFGLQSSLLIAERAAHFGIPFALMSATLPASLIRALCNRLELESIEGDRLPTVNGGAPRDVSINLHDCGLNPGKLDVLTQILGNSHKALIVMNTVGRAIDLYEVLSKHYQKDRRVLLAHSRFCDEDRAAKEAEIVEVFGKRAEGRDAILVATQVVEVGLDISCDKILTELAPVDSLIQRAGRCVRWGGRGQLHIFTEVEHNAPYEAPLMDATRTALVTRNGCEFDWPLEKKLVDDVLGPYFQKWADPDKAGPVLRDLAEAAFTGGRRRAEAAVRDPQNSLSVEVAIHDNPRSLGPDVLRLPRCNLSFKVFDHFFREKSARAWKIEIDRKPFDDYQIQIDAHVVGARDLLPGNFYAVDPRFASYDCEFGLRLDRAGRPAQVGLPKVGRARISESLRPETWIEHVDNIVREFDDTILPKERFAFRTLARSLKIDEDLLYMVMRLVLVLHDLGKLTVRWQGMIKRGLVDPALACAFLAHRGAGISGLPPHATVSAWVASGAIYRAAGGINTPLRNSLIEPAISAIAHHHSVRAVCSPEFQMAHGWSEPVLDRVRVHTKLDLAAVDFGARPPNGSGKAAKSVDFMSPGYNPYVLLSRWLRLSDRAATGGGEHAIFDYEKWFGDI